MTQSLPHSSTSAASLLPGAELCVHCGFCLQACPTYLALDDENDSPRGRIVLMKALAEGVVAETDTDATVHLDRCLGCRACETACPSGVPYGQLLELTRERLAERRPLPAMARLILWSFAHPLRLTIAMWGARLLRASRLPRLLSRAPAPVGFAMAMLDSTRRPTAPKAYDSRGDGARGAAAILTGCVMEGLFTNVNRATERTLIVNGYSVVAAPGQRCCGALHAHAGKADEARALARANIAAFEASGAHVVVMNSAGCGTMMKEYGHLLRGDASWRDRATQFSARVRDVSEVLAAAGPVTGARLPMRVAYDAPCHLQHGQRVTVPPLAVLAAVPGLELVPLTDNDQ